MSASEELAGFAGEWLPLLTLPDVDYDRFQPLLKDPLSRYDYISRN